MTQVAMIFEEEKQQAVEQAVKQAVEAERKKASDSKQQAVKRAVERERKKAFDSEQETVIKMIEKGYSTEEIVFLFSGYSKKEVEILRKKVQDAKNDSRQ